MGKRTVSAALIAAMTMTILAFTASGTASASTGSDESAFVSKINHERSSRGLRTLSVRSDLASYARRHSREMAAKGTIYHSSSSQMVSAAGPSWRELGENVGVGPDVNSLHQAFMASTAHRDNILHRTYNQIGVGVAYGNDGNIYVTEFFALRSGGTVAKTATTSAPRRAAASRPVAHAASVAPKLAAKPVVAQADPRTVNLLVRMIGMDAASIDPKTGEATGL